MMYLSFLYTKSKMVSFHVTFLLYSSVLSTVFSLLKTGFRWENNEKYEKGDFDNDKIL